MIGVETMLLSESQRSMSFFMKAVKVFAKEAKRISRCMVIILEHCEKNSGQQQILVKCFSNTDYLQRGLIIQTWIMHFR